MIHELFPESLDIRFQTSAIPGEDDFVFYYQENTLLWKNEDGSLVIPRRSDFPSVPETSEFRFLFSLGNVPCFLLLGNLGETRPDLAFHELSLFRTHPVQLLAWASLVGYHLFSWYRDHRFCGRCGAPALPMPEERALGCSSCSRVVYPGISPAIIVAVICGDKILLIRGRSGRSWYSLVSGYVDAGETLEQAVAREVKEETGLDVRNIRYYNDQPWPLSGTLMVGFLAEADDRQAIVVDDNEISEAAWFTRGSLPEYSPALAISGELIRRFDRNEL